MADLPVVNKLDEIKEIDTDIREGQINAAKIFESNMQALVQTNKGLAVALDSMNLTLAEMFNIDQERLEALREQLRLSEEERRERGRERETGAGTAGADVDNRLDLAGLAGLGAFAALASSIFGFDEYLRALGLPKIFDGFKTSFTKFTDGIKKIKLPDVTISNTAVVDNIIKQAKIAAYAAVGLGEDGRPIIRRAPDGTFRAGLFSQIRTAIRGIVTGFTTGLDTIKQTLIAGGEGGTLFTRISTVFSALIDEFTKPIRLLTESNPFSDKVAEIRRGITTFFESIPRFNFNVPESAFSFARALGSVSEGTGILGFFGKAFGILEPILKPLKTVLGVILRPFTQFVLTFIDFITGFYDGFTSEDGSFMDKMMAGLEGGIKGVIKGITDAIDLIFVKFPAFIAEKLGFQETADALGDFSFTELVDPIWDSIKKFFTTLLSGDISGAAGMVVGGVEEFFKTVLRALLPDPTADFGLLDPRFALQKLFKAIGTYEYVGINADTGEMMEQVSPTDTGTGAGGVAGGEVQTRSEEVEESKRPQTGGNAVVAPVQVDASSSQNVSQVNAFGGTSAQRQKDNPVMYDIPVGA